MLPLGCGSCPVGRAGSFFCVSCLLNNQQHLRTDTHHIAASYLIWGEGVVWDLPFTLPWLNFVVTRAPSDYVLHPRCYCYCSRASSQWPPRAYSQQLVPIPMPRPPCLRGRRRQQSRPKPKLSASFLVPQAVAPGLSSPQPRSPGRGSRPQLVSASCPQAVAPGPISC